MASSLSPQCISTVKAVVRDGLRLDGFAYSYPASPFSVCDKRHGVAMVILGPNAFSASGVRAYGPKTVSDRAERVILQSLVYRANTQDGAMILDPAEVEALYLTHPQALIYGNGGSYSDAKAGVTIRAPDGSEERSGVRQLTATASSYPQLIMRHWVGIALPHPLLWSDLVGVSTTPAIDVWIQHHLFGCAK